MISMHMKQLFCCPGSDLWRTSLPVQLGSPSSPGYGRVVSSVVIKD